MHVQDLQDPEKIVNMMNNTKLLMIGMKPNNSIKIDTVRLH